MTQLQQAFENLQGQTLEELAKGLHRILAMYKWNEFIPNAECPKSPSGAHRYHHEDPWCIFCGYQDEQP